MNIDADADMCSAAMSLVLSSFTVQFFKTRALRIQKLNKIHTKFKLIKKTRKVLLFAKKKAFCIFCLVNKQAFGRPFKLIAHPGLPRGPRGAAEQTAYINTY